MRSQSDKQGMTLHHKIIAGPPLATLFTILTHHINHGGFREIRESLDGHFPDVRYRDQIPTVILLREEEIRPVGTSREEMNMNFLNTVKTKPLGLDDEIIWRKFFDHYNNLPRSAYARALRKTEKQAWESVSRGLLPQEFAGALESPTGHFYAGVAEWGVDLVARGYQVVIKQEYDHGANNNKIQTDRFQNWWKWNVWRLRHAEALYKALRGDIGEALLEMKTILPMRSRVLLRRDELLAEYTTKLRAEHPQAAVVLIRGHAHIYLNDILRQRGHSPHTIMPSLLEDSLAWMPSEQAAIQFMQTGQFDELLMTQELIPMCSVSALMEQNHIPYFAAMQIIRRFISQIDIEVIHNCFTQLRLFQADPGSFNEEFYQRRVQLWKNLQNASPNTVPPEIERAILSPRVVITPSMLG